MTHRPIRGPVARPIRRDDRLSASRRGYDRRWQRYRAAYLADHPLCVECGRVATEVDHIHAVHGGQDDPLFWVSTNHQALCHVCHSAKTYREDGALGT